MKRRVFWAFLFLICCLRAANVAQAASEEFFKGKPVRLLIGVSAGGALDDWGRFVAPHMGKQDRKSTRLNSSHIQKSRMPSSA